MAHWLANGAAVFSIRPEPQTPTQRFAADESLRRQRTEEGAQDVPTRQDYVPYHQASFLNRRHDDFIFSEGSSDQEDCTPAALAAKTAHNPCFSGGGRDSHEIQPRLSNLESEGSGAPEVFDSRVINPTTPSAAGGSTIFKKTLAHPQLAMPAQPMSSGSKAGTWGRSQMPSVPSEASQSLHLPKTDAKSDAAAGQETGHERKWKQQKVVSSPPVGLKTREQPWSSTLQSMRKHALAAAGYTGGEPDSPPPPSRTQSAAAASGVRESCSIHQVPVVTVKINPGSSHNGQQTAFLAHQPSSGHEQQTDLHAAHLRPGDRSAAPAASARPTNQEGRRVVRGKISAFHRGSGRMRALGLQILGMQSGVEAMPERIIRERMGNNPDTSKALRRMCLEGKLSRTGTGGRSNPFLYSATQQGRMLLQENRNLVAPDSAHMPSN